jgi:hypothetical protein
MGAHELCFEFVKLKLDGLLHLLCLLDLSFSLLYGFDLSFPLVKQFVVLPECLGVLRNVIHTLVRQCLLVVAQCTLLSTKGGSHLHEIKVIVPGPLGKASTE